MNGFEAYAKKSTHYYQTRRNHDRVVTIADTLRDTLTGAGAGAEGEKDSCSFKPESLVTLNPACLYNASTHSIAFFSREYLPNTIDELAIYAQAKLYNASESEARWHQAMCIPRPIHINSVNDVMILLPEECVDNLIGPHRIRAVNVERQVDSARLCARNVRILVNGNATRPVPPLNEDVWMLILSYLVTEYSAAAAYAKLKTVSHLFYRVVWRLKCPRDMHSNDPSGTLRPVRTVVLERVKDAARALTWLDVPLGVARRASLPKLERIRRHAQVVLHLQRESPERLFAPFESLRRLHIRSVNMDNALMKALEKVVPQLSHLSLNACASLNEEHLVRLVSLGKKLRFLNVSDNSNSLVRLEHLAPHLTNLTALDISLLRGLEQTSIDALGAALDNSTTLRYLDMGHCIRALRFNMKLPVLEVLYLDGCLCIDMYDDFRHIDLRGCTALRSLDLSSTGATSRSGGVLKQLSVLTSLESLHLVNCASLMQEDIRYLAANLPTAVRYVNVSGKIYDGEAALEPLAKEMLSRQRSTFIGLQITAQYPPNTRYRNILWTP